MEDVLNYRALGKRIRHKRKVLGMTQDQLSKSIGSSLSFLGHIERGSRKASMSTLLRICEALSVLPDDLLCDSISWTALNDPLPSEVEEDTFDILRKLVDQLETEHGKSRSVKE